VNTRRYPSWAGDLDKAPAAEGELGLETQPVRLTMIAAQSGTTELVFMSILGGLVTRAMAPYAVEYSADCAKIPSATEKE
jgi:hypothetical protein